MNALLPRPALAFAFTVALAPILAGCTKASPIPSLIPSPIEGETVCADYAIPATHAKMHGGLRRPVVLMVLSGKEVIGQAILSGTSGQAAARTTIPLPDADAEYQLDWAQCAVPLGPYPMEQAVPVLECDAPVYKSEPLATKKGDTASRAIRFVPPPEAGCWPEEGAPIPGAVPVPAPAPAPVK